MNWKSILIRPWLFGKRGGPILAIPAIIGSALGASAATAAATGLTAIGVAGGVGLGIASASGAFSSKASTINPNPSPTATQTVDPSSSSNVNNLGRAALVYTSPQGVQGTDPVNRYSLLGNNPGLGNT